MPVRHSAAAGFRFAADARRPGRAAEARSSGGRPSRTASTAGGATWPAARRSCRPVSVRAISGRNRRRPARSARRAKSPTNSAPKSATRSSKRMHAVDSVDFDINIGVAVPSTIVLHPLPPRIIEIVPAYAELPVFRARGRDDHHCRAGQLADRLRHRLTGAVSGRAPRASPRPFSRLRRANGAPPKRLRGAAHFGQAIRTSPPAFEFHRVRSRNRRTLSFTSRIASKVDWLVRLPFTGGFGPTFGLRSGGAVDW